MYSVIEIFGRALPMYGICIMTGAVLAGVLAACRLQPAYAASHDRFELTAAMGFCLAGVVLGGKLLYLILNFPSILANWEQIRAGGDGIRRLISYGFVFYGGLAGAVLMLWLYARFLGGYFPALALNLIPVVPVVHAFGRVGCFMAGCCYGIPYEGPGHVVFRQALGGAPNGVPLFPVQLLECVLNLLLAAFLFVYQKRNPYSTGMIGWYGVFYGTARFGLEFLRGDAERGALFGISTSQWISLVLIVVGIFIIIKRRDIAINKQAMSSAF